MLAEATQTWFPGVPELNSRLPEVAAAASAVAPGVVVADTDAGFDRIATTWDESHPNAVGEAMDRRRRRRRAGHARHRHPTRTPIARLPPAPGSRHYWRRRPRDGGAKLDVDRSARRDRPVRLAARSHGGLMRGTGSRLARDRLGVEGESARQRTSVHQLRLQPVKGDEAAQPTTSGPTSSRCCRNGCRPPYRSRAWNLLPMATRVSWRAAARATSYRVAWWPVGSRSAARSRTVTGTSTPDRRALGAQEVRRLRGSGSVQRHPGSGRSPRSRPYPVARPRAQKTKLTVANFATGSAGEDGGTIQAAGHGTCGDGSFATSGPRTGLGLRGVTDRGADGNSTPRPRGGGLRRSWQ